MNWEALIKIFEKYGESGEFVAECVYAYLSEHSPDDIDFMNDLCEVISNEISPNR